MTMLTLATLPASVADSLRLTLAAVSSLDSYGGGIYGRRQESTDYTPFIIGGAVLVCFLVAVYVYDRLQKSKAAAAKPEKRTLFGDLCSTHGLNVEERRNLEALATQQNIEPAAAIFVRPELIAPLAENSSQPELWASIQAKAFGNWE